MQSPHHQGSGLRFSRRFTRPVLPHRGQYIPEGIPPGVSGTPQRTRSNHCSAAFSSGNSRKNRVRDSPFRVLFPGPAGLGLPIRDHRPKNDFILFPMASFLKRGGNVNYRRFAGKLRFASGPAPDSCPPSLFRVFNRCAGRAPFPIRDVTTRQHDIGLLVFFIGSALSPRGAFWLPRETDWPPRHCPVTRGIRNPSWIFWEQGEGADPWERLPASLPDSCNQVSKEGKSRRD